MLLVQALINGVLVGAVWGVLGLGKQIVLGVIHFVNFAHGHLVLVAMYLAFVLWSVTGADPFLLLPVVVVLMAGLGWVLDRLLVRPLVPLGERSQMIATLAFALIIQSLALIVFSPQPRSIQTWWADTAWQVGGLFVNYGQLMGLVVSMVAFAATWWVIRRTALGAMIRATSQNREAAQYMGINIRRVYGIAFVLSVALAGVVGGVFIVSSPVDPTAAWGFLILMFVVPVLGGLGSIPGTMIAGIVVGVVQVLSSTYLDIQLQNALVFVLFLGFLVLRPQGILGKATDQFRISV
ncbi:branched-chain amino acid ABC transporter permease [Pseudonocardia sp.]|uniref:branched-chain amino acid ABC transporter permease n=1 Tax=Pseudonocardia sp. TaxID=60912 RepID=UPI003D0E0EB0